MTYQEMLDYFTHVDMLGSHLGLTRMEELLALLDSPQKRLKFIHVAGTNGKGSTSDYFTHVDMLGSHLGLTRMEELLALLDSPQKRLKFIHVAGTNGKGSTSALLDACLRQAGLRVGLYTSPHLVRYNERFRINGEEVSDEALCAAAARVKAAADTMEDAPTQFELLTCVGFCCFEAAGCDIVVLEVGLGGRLDATNVIPAPEAAVITRIGLEHTELLGDTLEKIAAEKAGIVKAGGTVVLGDHAEPVRRTVEEICRQRGARLIQAEEPAPLARSLEGQRFSWGPYPEVCLSLLGEHQLQNAATALAVLEVLRERGWPISDQAVLEGMAHAVWPGRFECAGTHPAIIVDGGHNPQCAQAVAASLAAYFPGNWRCWRSCGSGGGPSRTRRFWRAWPMPCGRGGSSAPGPIPPSSWTAATIPSAPRRWPHLSRPISRERRSLS